MEEKLHLGGQAVIEGVMMRSPHAFAVAVRKPSGEIVIAERPWRSLGHRFAFLRWPFFRGSVVLVESLVNGIQALNFSVNQAVPEAEGKPADQTPEEISPWALASTLVLAIGLALALFVALPHYLTARSLGLSAQSFAFHLVDGLIKVVFLVLYILGISLLKDIRRVFMYHGAEHKVIFAFEAGEPLTLEYVTNHSTLHPRCGTAFLLFVVVVSILLFAALFPWLPRFSQNFWLNNLAQIGVKLPLLFPVAGISYEFIKLAGKRPDHPVLRLAAAPGLLLQRLTTREPTPDQIEVAIRAVEAALYLERNRDGHERPVD
ncbi:MAG: hypothetical protein A2V67_04255 [Deltaproteobacteria bacterium RBG_13_61_14]|nr:MAG: hypothetical protein A2V67_04255 [Deltaproteobacteria bacterium RBG_13_61_14]